MKNILNEMKKMGLDIINTVKSFKGKVIQNLKSVFDKFKPIIHMVQTRITIFSKIIYIYLRKVYLWSYIRLQPIFSQIWTYSVKFLKLAWNKLYPLLNLIYNQLVNFYSLIKKIIKAVETIVRYGRFIYHTFVNFIVDQIVSPLLKRAFKYLKIVLIKIGPYLKSFVLWLSNKLEIIMNFIVKIMNPIFRITTKIINRIVELIKIILPALDKVIKMVHDLLADYVFYYIKEGVQKILSFTRDLLFVIIGLPFYIYKKAKQ